jgi:hypothetical protein
MSVSGKQNCGQNVSHLVALMSIEGNRHGRIVMASSTNHNVAKM